MKVKVMTKSGYPIAEHTGATAKVENNNIVIEDDFNTYIYPLCTVNVVVK